MARWEGQTYSSESDPAENYPRTYEWTYRGDTFEWSMDIPKSVYEYRRERQRIYDYGSYVADDVTQSAFASFCDSLHEQATANGYSPRDTVAFVTKFVQSLPYTPDDVSTEYSNYPRYPTETLVDETGDCEDTSLLLATLLYGLDYRVGLLEFEDHLALGVVLPDAEDNITFDGVDYTYVEATDTSWDVGQVPPRYLDEPAALHTVTDAPALHCYWRCEADSESLRCQGAVRNLGEGPADDVSFRLIVDNDRGQTAGWCRQEWNRLESDEELTWSENVRLTADGVLQPEWTLAIENVIHDQGTGRRRRL